MIKCKQLTKKKTTKWTIWIHHILHAQRPIHPNLTATGPAGVADPIGATGPMSTSAIAILYNPESQSNILEPEEVVYFPLPEIAALSSEFELILDDTGLQINQTGRYLITFTMQVGHSALFSVRSIVMKNAELEPMRSLSSSIPPETRNPIQRVWASYNMQCPGSVQFFVLHLQLQISTNLNLLEVFSLVNSLLFKVYKKLLLHN